MYNEQGKNKRIDDSLVIFYGYGRITLILVILHLSCKMVRVELYSGKKQVVVELHLGSKNVIPQKYHAFEGLNF